LRSVDVLPTASVHKRDFGVEMQRSSTMSRIFRAGVLVSLLLLEAFVIVISAMAQSSAGKFATTGSMSTGRVAHTATLLNDGRVLIAGGYAMHGTGLASAELYDPATGAFTPTGNMKSPRYRHTATLLPDGRVLVAGGSAGYAAPGVEAALASAEIYDPSTRTFSPAGDMTAPRFGGSATMLRNGLILIAGGHGTTAELYDPSSGKFRPTGSMIADRTCPLATLLPNGTVFLVSGGGVCGISDTAITNLAEVYDPAAGAFAPIGGPSPTDVSGDVAASMSMLPDGQVLMTLEGSDCSFFGPEAVLYNPSTALFSRTKDMATARCSSRGMELSDGAVLIAGAWSCTESATAEVYDPASGTFNRTGNMTAGRYLQTMTLLNDGRVLIAGGVGVTTSPCGAWGPSGAEIYNPRLVTPAPTLLSVPSDVQAQGAILHAGTAQVVSAANPAVVGEVVEIYSTGLLNGSVIPPQVVIDGRMAEVLWFGDAPGFSGLNQINVRLPNAISPRPSVPVRLYYRGRPSNEVTLAVQ
jgi:Kelch motif/Galactose oxidase, central domain